MDIKYTRPVSDTIRKAIEIAMDMHHELIEPEHLLMALLADDDFAMSYSEAGGSVSELFADVRKNLQGKKNNAEGSKTPNMSSQMQEIFARSAMTVSKSGNIPIGIAHLAGSILGLPDSEAQGIFKKHLNGNRTSKFLHLLAERTFNEPTSDDSNGFSIRLVDKPLNIGAPDEMASNSAMTGVRNISEIAKLSTPVIGRGDAVNQTIETLCRLNANGVLHIGEHGVGKTKMLIAIANRITYTDAPRRLKDCTVYEVDMSTITNGVQMRGEIEQRLAQLVDTIRNKGNAIICLDGIDAVLKISHNSDSPVDMLGMLKPFLKEEGLFFIATTSPDSRNRFARKFESFESHFNPIIINEPTKAEALEILQHEKVQYEKFHRVKYSDEAISYAVDMSIKHLRNQPLPLKALNIIDQAGAHREMRSQSTNKLRVSKSDIAAVIRTICGLKAVGDKEEKLQIAALASNMKSKIFGQNEAIERIVETIQTWKAGLNENGKPIANFLFVGPTGVGKTAIAQSLSDELEMPLVRFDMSEYAEKHTISKLLGSPAGYIGYDDGGLLTAALQKSPNSVVLLDEIEKAHPDIFNVLLQVMDYGVLTDNRGQKVSFQNAIIIMTSNAGAQYAHMASLGYASKQTSGSAMLTEVRKMFKPEFINRLTATIVFNEMNEEMASLILSKKIEELAKMLSDRSVEIEVLPEAFKQMLDEGFSKEYGAREIDRLITHSLKPLLVNEILFGKLRKGGKAQVCIDNKALKINVVKSA